MSRGTRYSGVLHTVLLLLAIFGLPSLFNAAREAEPMAITVDILPISEISNVKSAEQTPQKEKEPEQQKKDEIKPDPQEAKDTKKPVPKTKTEQAQPTPKVTEKAKEVIKEPLKKEEDKKDKKKKQEDDFDAVLKSIEKTKQKKEAGEQKDDKKSASDTKSKSDRYDDSMPLSMSEKDAIRGQFVRCWNMPAGAKDAHNLVVVLHIKLAQDGSVTGVELDSKQEGKYASDNFFRAAADSAQRAVKQCSPLQGLSADKYSSWKEMELTFDPHDLLY